MKIIAIANQKGGVGKTSTTMNLGVTLAKAGKRILLLDFDPQHNLSNYLKEEKYELTIAEAIQQELNNQFDYEKNLIQSYSENLDYIPTSLNLSAIEMSLIMASAREYILSDIFNRLNVKEKYDYVLIDCMPALNILLINALTASTSVLIPVEASYGAFEGLGQLFQYIELVKKRLNRGLEVEGILFTKVSNTKISKELKNRLSEEYGNVLLKQEIKELTEARRSYAERVPLQQMAKSKLAENYVALAKEILEKGE